jgi:hypothetical protein
LQVVVHVLCSKGPSLRAAIARDSGVDRFGLVVSEERRQHRRPGWAKVHSADRSRGALNIQWSSASSTLTCRVVTKGSRKPSPVVGDFINYVLDRHKGRVKAITTAYR